VKVGPGIFSVDHVQIAVPRTKEAACLAFYRDVLRLHEIEKPEELKARGGAWFQVGQIQVHIGVEDHESPTSKRHVCFLIKDLSAAEAWIRKHGLAIEPGGTAEGLTRFFICDPAGNRIEIGQR
jgi:catechol 2,3-dioxygenase-like lactoylglutathione lyase family enzyme